MDSIINILSIEDDKAYRKLLSIAVEDMPINLTFATGLQEGIKIAKKNRPPVILLDLVLKDSSPENTINSIKEFDDSAVVILSGEQGSEFLQEAYRQGADSYLDKNIVASRERLFSVIYNAWMRREFKPLYCRNCVTKS